MTFTFALVALAIFTILYFLRVNNRAIDRVCKSLKTLEGKTALVTGGTAGMGLVIAKDFARRKARVIIACPFEKEGLDAQKLIEQETGNKHVIFKLLDLGSLQSVREFAADILKTEDRLDLLINNAGIGMPRNFETKDGLNFIMQVNYYGHFLLTILLLPLLKKTGAASEPARIVNTTSRLHYLGRVDLSTNKGGIDWLNLNSYCNSKFSLILQFSRELSRRLRAAGVDIVINSVNPGTVGTGIYKSLGTFLGALCRYLLIFCSKTAEMGAQTALHVALDESAGQQSGEYFKNCRQAIPISRVFSEKYEKVLWEESAKLVKLTDEELVECIKY